MQLEKQVTSLELSKKLKELGLKQESLFYWHISYETVSEEYGQDYIPYIFYHKDESRHGFVGGGNYSAFTVAELGEMLPEYSHSWKVENQWICSLKTIPSGNPTISAETEADARAKMLIYLLENNLIEL